MPAAVSADRGPVLAFRVAAHGLAEKAATPQWAARSWAVQAARSERGGVRALSKRVRSAIETEAEAVAPQRGCATAGVLYADLA